MATPSSPKLISPITTVTNDDASPTKKPQPIPWTHQETVNLIRAYREKWYSLKRGPLRSNQWEEVAVVVAARCGYDFGHPSKSAVQCRHKMEKLRQRHRAEKHRIAGGTPSRFWPYSSLMDELEHGPQPISARPIATLAPSGGNNNIYNNCDHDVEEDDGDDEEDEDDKRENYRKSMSINYILSQRPQTNRYGGVSRGLLKMDDYDDNSDNNDEVVDDEEEEVAEERVVVDERGLVSGLTMEIKAFAERFIGVENSKMKMMKETERYRLQMENKRIEMILESQRRIVDSIGRAFGSSKRMKISEEI